MKYRVIVNKWVYVNADSADEAMDKAAAGGTVYEEEEPTEAAEVDEFRELVGGRKADGAA